MTMLALSSIQANPNPSFYPTDDEGKILCTHAAKAFSKVFDSKNFPVTTQNIILMSKIFGQLATCSSQKAFALPMIPDVSKVTYQNQPKLFDGFFDEMRRWSEKFTAE